MTSSINRRQALACSKAVAEHNKAELSKLEYRQQAGFIPGASGKVTGTTRLKVRVGNPAASRLDESSDKALNAGHDNQAKPKDLTVPITSLTR